ncbi:N-acetylated-alpha-linked acidic dipeptidase 2 [Pleomassaria siparia CBS 279.74]|uniref:N-acetylated-alpha-linked acidic dipeptidase 2 n=1 Tax=Pleomassaria siparia CBS 279.74 TaxID=1314801 RepID=A0A6G1KI25_9PLEO|nr:N-acetylated-alpha-linked acidic dipeptidase 2 [Pleomassaria siparia CBS 279.74]
MVDEKHVYEAYESPPIPTYEEATSSLTASRLGPQEISDDAERQGLLGHELATETSSRRRNGYYHPPSVQSARSSEDSGLGSPVRESDDDELRQEMEEMDILDPESADDGRARRNRSRGRFSKRFYSITNSFSQFHLPRIPWPSFGFSWLTSRLPTIPEEYRPGWAIIARLCGLVLIIALVYILVVSEIFQPGAGFGQPFNLESVRQFATENINPVKIEENLKYITSYDHVGGSEGSYYLGQWIQGKFRDAHMDALTHDEYFVYMNYPKKDGRRVAIIDPPEKVWEAKLEEGSAYNPPRAQTAAFHGLSASGNVTGRLIYANYGHKKDFKRLWDSGIDVQGAIVLLRYHNSQSDRAMKMKAAQNAGVAGVLIYSDPAEDGFKKGAVWPNGRWRPEDSIQRGSVALTSWIAGDVLTPGSASTSNQKRIPKENNPGLTTVPSIPLSWKNAQKLLQSLNGVGEALPDEWVGAVPDVGDKWFSGHHNSSPIVNLRNFQDQVEKQRISNVFGSFIGSEDKAKKVIVGNHRDAWCFGAANPGSGTAVMLEIARVLGDLRLQGWRPLRTIEFASWDAEEYNLMGSTEHVEGNMEELRANAIAYLNVDSGVTGNKLRANGSPILTNAWLRVLGRLNDAPNQREKTLRNLWDETNSKIGGLGAGSDYVAFQHMAGCSSIDFGFEGPEHGGMYHSCYESFDWMTKYVDPGFKYHVLLAQVWVLLILELSQEPIVPLKLQDYAESLQEEALALVDWTETKGQGYNMDMFQPLIDAVSAFTTKAKEFHSWEDYWYGQVVGAGGFEAQGLTVQRIQHNARLANFETNLLDINHDMGKEDNIVRGLPGRAQYKHTIYAPDVSGSGVDSSIFPFARDAIEANNWTLATEMIQKTADTLNYAVDKLMH